MIKLFMILITVLTLGCGSRQLTVNPATDTEQVCDPTFALAHIEVVADCSNPAIYSNEVDPIFYGVCEDGGQLSIVSLILPTELYLMEGVSEAIEGDGGRAICMDETTTIIEIP